MTAPKKKKRTPALDTPHRVPPSGGLKEAEESARPVAPPPGPSPKQRAAIDAVVKAIQKEFGPAAIGRLSASYEDVIGAMPSGLLHLDAAIGVGGIPWGKVIELYGPESVGKTTLCKYLAGVAQRAGFVAYFIDREASVDIDPVFDRHLGLDSSQLLLSKPPEVQSLEQCLMAIEAAVLALLKIKAPGIVFFDSIAAAPMNAEMEGTMEDNVVPGRRAFMLGRHLPRVLAWIDQQPIILIYVNQEREKINAPAFAEKTYSPGGRAFRHYAHLRLQMGAWGQLKVSEQIVGQKVSIRVRKSKVAPPRKEAKLLLHYVGTLTDDPSAD